MKCWSQEASTTVLCPFYALNDEGRIFGICGSPENCGGIVVRLHPHSANTVFQSITPHTTFHLLLVMCGTVYVKCTEMLMLLLLGYSEPSGLNNLNLRRAQTAQQPTCAPSLHKITIDGSYLEQPGGVHQKWKIRSLKKIKII